MVAGAVKKNLRLIFQSTKRARMNDPRPVALEFRSVIVSRLRILSAARFTGFLREWRQNACFVLFHLFAGLPTGPIASRMICHARIILSPDALCESRVTGRINGDRNFS